MRIHWPSFKPSLRALSAMNEVFKMIFYTQCKGISVCVSCHTAILGPNLSLIRLFSSRHTNIYTRRLDGSIGQVCKY